MFLLVVLPIHLKWLLAFGLTLLIELPFFVMLGRKYAGVLRCVAAGILGSAITHPLLWFVWRRVFDNYLLYVISGEILVCMVEGVVFWWVLRSISFQKALAVSLLANATSYGIGVLLHAVDLL